MNDLKHLTAIKNNFSDAYIALRKKEGRVYKDSELVHLPDVDHDHPHFNEWEMRKKSANRFIDYVKNKSVKRILDIGCGNGWFTNLIAKNNYANVFGLDVNLVELEQAQRVFKKDNLFFGYGDIFEKFFTDKFDLIVLNSSIQYFPNLEELIVRLKEILAPHGEIHILDSPIYETDKKALEAKKKTEEYYKSMDAQEMINYYYHHTKSSLEGFKVMYEPMGTLKKLLGKKDVPFRWYAYID